MEKSKSRRQPASVIHVEIELNEDGGIICVKRNGRRVQETNDRCWQVKSDRRREVEIVVEEVDL